MKKSKKFRNKKNLDDEGSYDPSQDYSPQRLPEEYKRDQGYLKRINESGQIVDRIDRQSLQDSYSNQDHQESININISKSNSQAYMQGGNGYPQAKYAVQPHRVSSSNTLKNTHTSMSRSAHGESSVTVSANAMKPRNVNGGLRTKQEMTAITQLTANILEIMAQGEKSCEIIRSVLFEMKGFNAFDLFMELREYGPAKQKEVQKQKQLKKLMAESQNDVDTITQQQIDNLNMDLEITKQENSNNQEDDQGPDVEGIDDKAINCFLEVGLETGTLRTELTIKECTFLVNLITEENNMKAIPYESFIDFIIPQSKKKVSTRLLKKIKRKEVYEIKKCGYDVLCTLAKLFECEIQIKRKIQRQIQKFHARIVGADFGKGDLQIAELFQTMDAKNEGKINKAQIKGLLVVHGSRNMVPDADIKALCRRLDNDQDGEVSFSDFFGALLPYFIYGNLKSLNEKNPMAIEAGKPMSLRKKLLEIKNKSKNPQMSDEKLRQRGKSAKLAKTTLQKGFFNKHQDLLVFEEGKKYDFQQDAGGFTCLRQKSPGAQSNGARSQDGNSASKPRQRSKSNQKLFSQNQPELHFYRSPALSNVKGFIRKNQGLQPSHVPYMEPLMKFFHDSIDFERVMEINKQELILQDDYSIYHIFNILSGSTKGNSVLNLPLVDLQTNLSKLFNVKFSYKEIKLALIRQFPISAATRVEQMRYQDFQDLMRPKNKEFQSYVQRKLKTHKDSDQVINMYNQTEVGISYITHMKLGKLFEDLLQLENQLELHRRYKLSQINIRDAFRCIDRKCRGFATLEDYYVFFEDFYSEDLPVSTEEIDYLFKRHDREQMGRVTEAIFLKELMPLDDYIVID